MRTTVSITFYFRWKGYLETSKATRFHMKLFCGWITINFMKFKGTNKIDKAWYQLCKCDAAIGTEESQVRWPIQNWEAKARVAWFIDCIFRLRYRENLSEKFSPRYLAEVSRFVYDWSHFDISDSRGFRVDQVPPLNRQNLTS